MKKNFFLLFYSFNANIKKNIINTFNNVKNNLSLFNFKKKFTENKKNKIFNEDIYLYNYKDEIKFKECMNIYFVYFFQILTSLESISLLINILYKENLMLFTKPDYQLIKFSIFVISFIIYMVLNQILFFYMEYQKYKMLFFFLFNLLNLFFFFSIYYGRKSSKYILSSWKKFYLDKIILFFIVINILINNIFILLTNKQSILEIDINALLDNIDKDQDLKFELF